jgi:hypothetical protein
MTERAHSRTYLLLQIALAVLLCPVPAQAHGEQVVAFPLSGLLAFLAMIPIALRVRARVKAKILAMVLCFPVFVFLTWWIVARFLNPAPASLYEHFILYTVAMAVPPVLGCLSVLEILGTHSPSREK